jgi:hypothetical protein
MGLSLKQARLCLDCDCLTDEVFCPWCDRDGTVPLAGWFRPLDDGPSNASRHGKAVAPVARQWVLIVQPRQRELYRVLRQALAKTGVEVLYERRVGQRRRTDAGPGAGERRRIDRRRPRPTAVVYRSAVTPEDPGRPSSPNVSREALRVARVRRRQPAPVQADPFPRRPQLAPQT